MKKLQELQLPEPLREHWAALQSAYQARAPREQLVLKILLGVIVLLLLWSILWQPLLNWRDSAIADYEREARLLAWIKANEAPLRQQMAASGRPAVATGGDWSSTVSRTLGSAGLTMKGMTPEGADAVRIVLENQPFSTVAGWLASVNQTLGASVANVEITPGTESGRVNVRATLRRGG